MAGKRQPQSVVLDLNNPVFLRHLFGLEQEEKLLVLKMLEKLAALSWEQVYRDKGLRWEKIHSIKLPGVDAPALYSLRISRGRRAVAYRDADIMRMLAIPNDHDATYGKK